MRMALPTLAALLLLLLLLKNNLRRQYASLGPEARAFVQACLLRMLGHGARPLRHTAGTCVVTLVSAAGCVLDFW